MLESVNSVRGSQSEVRSSRALLSRSVSKGNVCVRRARVSLQFVQYCTVRTVSSHAYRSTVRLLVFHWIRFPAGATLASERT
jgi:hypothetical protein